MSSDNINIKLPTPVSKLLLNMTIDQHTRLATFAARNGISKTAFIRAAIDHELETRSK